MAVTSVGGGGIDAAFLALRQAIQQEQVVLQLVRQVTQQQASLASAQSGRGTVVNIVV